MDGIFLINKPAGVTSRDVCNRIMKKFHFKKVGHVGTLDPFATGLLVVVMGKATKVVPFLEKEDKHYIATLKLGEKTDTLDLDGKVIERKEVPPLTKKQISKVLHSFVGKLNQLPPMYSAVKYKGVPLYKLARSNIEIDRKLRTIEILKVRLISFKDDLITFSLDCSKGTYVRTFGEQFAEKLGTVGHLVALKRTRVGHFILKNAKTVRSVKENNLINAYDALKFMDIVVVDEKGTKDVKDGKTMILNNHEDEVLFIDSNKNVLAVYQKNSETNEYKSLRGLF